MKMDIVSSLLQFLKQLLGNLIFMYLFIDGSGSDILDALYAHIHWVETYNINSSATDLVR